jgi:hemerythrin-like domain-containing protein
MATRRKTTKANDAIAMLTEDHNKVKKLFREFAQADHEDAERCREIAETTCSELKVHTALEEEIFYPAVKQVLQDEAELMAEAEVEHGAAKALIEKLEGLEPGTPEHAGAFTVLAEYVKHHIKEEQDEMFPKVRKAGLDRESLAATMRARKDELLEAAGMAGEAAPARLAGARQARAERQSRR